MLGRWTSPDAINVTDERVLNPSNTLNKYVYGGDNPLKLIDPDGRDITLFYSNEGPAGHEMLYAYDTSNGNSAVHSFGPESHTMAARVAELFDIPIQGTNSYGLEDIKSPDDLRQHYASFTVQLNPEETEKAIEFIKDLKDNNYLTYGRNCTSTCADILRKLKLHKWGEIAPQALFYNFASEHGNNSVPYPAQHGTDYGKPRAGYDPFQLLFLTIQHCHTETATWTENGKDTGTTTITVCN